ncbi:MAG: FAD-dependent oxidoreductase [Bacillota bacterium]
MSYLNKKYEISKSPHKYDVIIAGGGTAGSIAGIAASRKRKSTLIIDENSFLGGSSTGGQVTPMMSTNIPGNPVCSSISKEIQNRLIKAGHAGEDDSGNKGWFNPEYLKFILEEMVKDENGDILYDTKIVDVMVDNDNIKGVIVYNKSGFKLIKGKVFVDGTGDAVIASKAGVPCVEGPQNEDYFPQKVSLRFMMGNVDMVNFKKFLNNIGKKQFNNSNLFHTAMVWNKGWILEDIFKQGVEEGYLKYEDGQYFQVFSVPGMPGVLSFNCPEIPDPIDPFRDRDISYSYIKGRKMIKRLVKFLKKCIPGFKNSFILGVAPILGVRESRRIKGRYWLTEKDYFKKSKFADAIARTAYPLDIHGMEEEDLNFNLENKEGYMEIPFRSLIPQKIENLLVAGRSISSNFVIQSVLRIQPTCRATGEAAGLGAALAVNKELKVSKIEGRKIVTEMKKMGADI